jgi:hypothetical protein
VIHTWFGKLPRQKNDPANVFIPAPAPLLDIRGLITTMMVREDMARHNGIGPHFQGQARKAWLDDMGGDGR